MRLRNFQILSFDTFGTLIDWESGIIAALHPITERLSQPPDGGELLALFGEIEAQVEAERPTALYRDVLAEVHRRISRQLGILTNETDAARFAASINEWPAFADAAESLAYLGQHYRLLTVTNCDRQSYRGADEKLGQPWDAIYTAETIGTYKPDPAAFAFLLARIAELGCSKEDLLHVAQSRYHDHAPAQALGIATCWIDRRRGQAGSGATKEADLIREPDFTFSDLASLARAHQNEGSD